MNRKHSLILIFSFFLLRTFAQMPNGAKETFHLKVEQENRFCYNDYQQNGLNAPQRSEIIMSNGELVELAISQITFGASFLNDYWVNSEGFSRIDLDLGYEYNLTRSLKLQPFIGCEFNALGSGLSAGVKLNKSFEIFEYVNIGLFAGLRYSGLQSISFTGDIEQISKGCTAVSAGAYCMLYNYKRPRIIRNW